MFGKTNTGWHPPPLNSQPTMAGAQSMLSFLATRFKPEIGVNFNCITNKDDHAYKVMYKMPALDLMNMIAWQQLQLQFPPLNWIMDTWISLAWPNWYTVSAA